VVFFWGEPLADQPQGADESLDKNPLGAVATQEELGRSLTGLLEDSGLSARKAARQAGVPNSTVHDWLKGEHLPTDDEQVQALQRVLYVLGVTGPEQQRPWLTALTRVKRPAGRKPAGDAPYRGLASFEPGDAHLFFGREEVADRLAELMSDHADFHDLPLVLVGPSGAGKSSVLRAGLLPRLRGPAVVFEPTAEPLATLKVALIDLEAEAANYKTTRPAIVVDQFESVFTQVLGEARRREFIAELCDLAASRSAHVVIALRADFYDHAIRYPELAPSLQHRQVVLGPMTAEQVSRAITEPARLARLNVEDGLVPLLLDDLAPRGGPAHRAADDGAYDPGALPLLSHAMLATWENSHGGTLTIADYIASGRIKDAVARTSEAAFEALSPAEQELARRIFLRLVHVADDAPPTRATLPLSELRGWEAGAATQRVLDVFVAGRMITVDADNAQVTHDALLTAWPRLRSWIDTGQAGLVTRRRITEAARAWSDAGRDATYLWRGGQLELATQAGTDLGTLPKVAAEFIDASTDTERLRRLADRRGTRRLQGLVAILTVLVVIVGLTAAYAFSKRQDAITASNNATSRQLAVEAAQLRTTDPVLAAQLSIAGYGIARTPQAAAALLETSGAPSGSRIEDTSGLVQWADTSPDHALLAAAGSDGSLKLWTVADPGHPALAAALVAADASHPLYVAKFSPDGKVLAAAGDGGEVRLWNVSDPAHPTALPGLTGPGSSIYSLAFSPDGTMIAAGSGDDKAWLWHVSDPDAPAGTGIPLTGAPAQVNSVAFGLGDRVLAEGSADGTVRLWDLAAAGQPKGQPALAATLAGPGSVVTGVAFSRRGELAASSYDHKVWLWKVSVGPVAHTVKTGTGKKAKSVVVTTQAVQAVPDGTLSGAKGWVDTVAFNAAGTRLAAGTSDPSVLVWALPTKALTTRIPLPLPVDSVTWDGVKIATGDADGTATVWALPAPVLLTGNGSNIVAYSPDGTRIAVGGTSVQIWAAASHNLLVSRPTSDINGMSYSPDGTLLAAAYADGTVAILNAQTLAPVGHPLTATAHGNAESVAFSPDGKTLATGGDDGTVRLWSVADPAHPTLLAKVHDTGGDAAVYTVAFSPDGATLAVASTDNETRLWNVRSTTSPVWDGAALGGMSSYPVGLAFTPDSKLLAITSADKTVHLWNVANPARATPIGTPLTGPSGNAWAAAISPDGTVLAVGVTTGTVWLWNIANPATPVLIGTLTGPAGQVFSVAFNPAGTQLAAASADGTVFTWDASPAAALSQACANLGQPLSPAEWSAYVPDVPYKAPCS
jgi:WD40 repeat protein